jgi:hypothetical protein
MADRSTDRGTPEYSAGTGEYPTSDEEQRDADAGSQGDEDKKEWWERAGFSSLAEALANDERRWDRIWGRPVRDFTGMTAEEILLSKPLKVPPSTLARILVVRGTEVALGPDELEDDQDSG